ncbi:MAG: T9SS type A sorting domain-containing protein, partial [Salibacteraceae bacterium]|nr:T9SS type A sorting domain-containing protein [Salibacteraceae bacterium]
RLSVYPNPTSNVLYVNGDLDAAAQFTLTITDMFGKLVINRTMTGAELQTINTSTLPNGIYLLSVDNELSVFSTKVVVSH